MRASLIAALFALLSSSVTGNAQDKPVFEPGTTMARLQDAGKIVIGTRFDTPAIALKNPISGEMEGFDIALARHIARRLGLTDAQVEFTEVISANRETALTQGLVDMNVSGYVINDKRRAVVGQAGPYISVSTRLFIHEANKDRFNSKADMKGMTICSPPSASSVPFIQEAGATLIPINDNSVCFQQIANRQVEGTLSNDLFAMGFVANYAGLAIASVPPFTVEGWGVGFRKDDQAFCEFLQGAITDFIDSGAWENAWRGTFGALGLEDQTPPRPDGKC